MTHASPKTNDSDEPQSEATVAPTDAPATTALDTAPFDAASTATPPPPGHAMTSEEANAYLLRKNAELYRRLAE